MVKNSNIQLFLAPACQSKHTNFTKNWENHKKWEWPKMRNKMKNSENVRDVLVSCRVLDTLVPAVGLLCGARSVSYPQRPHRGYRLGSTRVPPSRQNDGNVTAPALACVACLAVRVVALACVRWWLFFPKWCVCPNPSSTDSLWRGCRATLQTPPINSHATLHCCSCWVSDSFYPTVALRVASVDFDLG